MKNPAFIKALQSFLNPSQLLQDEPMKLHTTFKIGGPADYLLFPSSAEEVGKILQLLKEYSIPLTILGNGSNVLVRDGGIRGAVVKFNHPMSSIRVEGTKIRGSSQRRLGRGCRAWPHGYGICLRHPGQPRRRRLHERWRL